MRGVITKEKRHGTQGIGRRFRHDRRHFAPIGNPDGCRPGGRSKLQILHAVEAATGSRIETMQCWTRAEWADQGVNVDHDWAKEGVGVIA